MSQAEELRKKYEADRLHLQDTCPHENLSDFMDEWWAPGHSSGRMVQVCENCEKVIHSKTACTGWYQFGCQNLVHDEKGYKHENQMGPGNYLWGLYCPECEERIKRKDPILFGTGAPNATQMPGRPSLSSSN